MLLDLRAQLKTIIHQPELRNLLRNQGDTKSVEYTVITDSPDSEVATLFELLESDTSDFFFGGTLHIMSEDQMVESRKMMSRVYQTPIKTLIYSPKEELGI